jgi:CelD/BcsL family acetyltransferase involved in cellulose biosynthesis
VLSAHAPKSNCQILSWSDWPAIAPVWSRLVARASRSSFFLTEPWIGAWIETFGPHLKPSILLLESAGEPVGACILSLTTPKLLRIPVRGLALNATGETSEHTIYSEYNDLVCVEGYENLLAQAVRSHASNYRWDEVLLNAFTPGPGYESLKQAFSGLDTQERRQPCYYVDLAAIRRQGLTYQAALSSANRYHVRRKLRYQSESGALRLDAACNSDCALNMFEELARLSRRRWESRRRECIFDSDLFVAFHRRLIARCCPHGGVQLLRVTAGGHVVGVVYNLVHQGRVYFYQCGYGYTSNQRLSPGTVALAMSIQYCLDAGFQDYDFLSGHAAYKHSLSTGSRDLVWAVFRRPGLKLRVLDRLARLNARLRDGFQR